MHNFNITKRFVVVCFFAVKLDDYNKEENNENYR